MTLLDSSLPVLLAKFFSNVSSSTSVNTPRYTGASLELRCFTLVEFRVRGFAFPLTTSFFLARLGLTMGAGLFGCRRR